VLAHGGEHLVDGSGLCRCRTAVNGRDPPDVGLRQGDRLAVEDGEQLSDEDPVGHPFRRTRTGESVDEVIEGQLAGPELEEVARDDLPLLSGCPVSDVDAASVWRVTSRSSSTRFARVRSRVAPSASMRRFEIGERGLGHDAAR